MNIKNRLLIVIILIWGSIQLGYAQNNPGFFGKKIAVGYSTQFSFINSIIGKEEGMSILKFLTHHDVYGEYSISKFKSLATHISYQKVPISSFLMMSNNGQINDDFSINGNNIHAWGDKAGFSNFRYLSLGFKYNIYSESKTVSAPVGLNYYTRFDIHSIKPISNTYVYDLYAGSDQQNDFVNQNINRDVKNTSSINFSVGVGCDTKLLLNETTFIRFNGEFNVSTVGITQSVKDNFFVEENTVKRDLKLTGQTANRFRNMFLFGMGIGILL